ncbi:MAG TPA: hypothetical protein VKG25_07000 [Bryobacteraceae bacterium]|nr:hypothetical protein [Bryobacteraceae bacterium]
MEGALVADLVALNLRQGRAVIVHIFVSDSGAGVLFEEGMFGLDFFLLLIHFVVNAARFEAPGSVGEPLGNDHFFDQIALKSRAGEIVRRYATTPRARGSAPKNSQRR